MAFNTTTSSTTASPYMGGLWEACVKSVKYHLHRTLGNNILIFDEVATLLTKIEACLNSSQLQHNIITQMTKVLLL